MKMRDRLMLAVRNVARRHSGLALLDWKMPMKYPVHVKYGIVQCKKEGPFNCLTCRDVAHSYDDLFHLLHSLGRTRNISAPYDDRILFGVAYNDTNFKLWFDGQGPTLLMIRGRADKEYPDGTTIDDLVEKLATELGVDLTKLPNANFDNERNVIDVDASK